jgi:cytochrome b561
MSRRSLFTKLLHAALLLAVAHQLVLVGLVERPRGASAGNVFFAWHQAVGLVTLGIVTVFWIWSLLRGSETAAGALFPWLSSRRRRALWMDIRAHVYELRRFRLKDADESALASAAHGLGLLVVCAMAGTGAAMALGGGAPGGPLLQIHRLLANLMWAYVVAHAGVALLHQAQGREVLQRMFGPVAG